MYALIFYYFCAYTSKTYTNQIIIKSFMKTIITSCGGVKAYQAPSCEQIDLLCSSSMLLNTSGVIESSEEEEYGEF